MSTLQLPLLSENLLMHCLIYLIINNSPHNMHHLSDKKKLLSLAVKGSTSKMCSRGVHCSTLPNDYPGARVMKTICPVQKKNWTGTDTFFAQRAWARNCARLVHSKMWPRKSNSLGCLHNLYQLKPKEDRS